MSTTFELQDDGTAIINGVTYDPRKEPEKRGAWRPSLRERYWAVYLGNGIRFQEWYDDDSCRTLLSLGFAFPYTDEGKAQAERELARRQAYVRLRAKCDEMGGRRSLWNETRYHPYGHNETPESDCTCLYGAPGDFTFDTTAKGKSACIEFKRLMSADLNIYYGE